MAKQKITFKGNRENGYKYSGREISSFTDIVSNSFFKITVLKELEEFLNSNKFDGKSVWILDDSFHFQIQYNNLYSKGGILNLNNYKDVRDLYHMGSPIAAINNTKSSSLYYSFSLYKNLTEYFNKLTNHPIIEKNKFFELLSQQNDEKITEFFKECKDQCARNLNDLNIGTETKWTVSQFERYKRELDSIFSTIIRDYNNEKGLLNWLEENQEKDKFVTAFASHAQPIICLYDEKENTLKVLGYDMVSRKSFTSNNDRFVETHSISQNSPLVLTLGLSLAIVIPFYIPVFKRQLQDISEKYRTEKKRENADIDKLGNYEDKISEMDAFFKKYEEYEFESINEAKDVQPISNPTLAQDFVRNELDDMKNSVIVAFDNKVTTMEILPTDIK